MKNPLVRLQSLDNTATFEQILQVLRAIESYTITEKLFRPEFIQRFGLSVAKTLTSGRWYVSFGNGEGNLWFIYVDKALRSLWFVVYDHARLAYYPDGPVNELFYEFNDGVIPPINEDGLHGKPVGIIPWIKEYEAFVKQKQASMTLLEKP